MRSTSEVRQVSVCGSSSLMQARRLHFSADRPSEVALNGPALKKCKVWRSSVSRTKGPHFWPSRPPWCSRSFSGRRWDGLSEGDLAKLREAAGAPPPRIAQHERALGKQLCATGRRFASRAGFGGHLRRARGWVIRSRLARSTSSLRVVLRGP